MSANSPAFKKTKQREAIETELAKTGNFRSAQQVHLALRAAGENVSLATVYRNLQMLADNGDLDVVRSEDGEALYRSCANDHHHHHMICRQCGLALDLADKDLEKWLDGVEKRSGFTSIAHRIELFGTCQSCQG